MEPYEDSIQAIQISSVCKRCTVLLGHWANRRCAKNCTETAANGSALMMYLVLGGVGPRQIGVVYWSCVFFSLC